MNAKKTYELRLDILIGVLFFIKKILLFFEIFLLIFDKNCVTLKKTYLKEAICLHHHLLTKIGAFV